MLNVLIALGIFATILVFLQGCAALHRAMTPRGKDRAIERLQKWSAPESVAQLEIVRKESFSDIPWLHDLLATMRRFNPCASFIGRRIVGYRSGASCWRRRSWGC